MGKINATNLMTFKSSRPLFKKIKKKLSSYNAAGLIDDTDFHEYVKYIIKQCGRAVFKECEAILHVKDYKAKLPANLLLYHAAWKCTPTFNKTKTINEQLPWVYYLDAEFTQECPGNCCITCGEKQEKTKVVVRTYVNGDDNSCDYGYNKGCLLKLSSNVKDQCTEECANLFCSDLDEITIDDEKVAHLNFTDDDVFLQYYGLPVDADGLPMIPDDADVEKAIEYHIYENIFENLVWNTTVPGIEKLLADARSQAAHFFAQARYSVKLPSFESCVKQIRRQRTRNKFYQLTFDKTKIV